MHEEVQFEQIDSSVTCFQGLYFPRLGRFLHALSMVFGVRKCPLFSETFPGNRKFYIDHPRAIWNRGKCPNGDLAVLIERVARTLLQRVGAYGWEPMEPVDADSLWENGRVKIEEKSDILDWWGGAGNYTAIPIRLELNFRRWVSS